MPALDHARLPFAEQIAFFRNKLGNLVPTQRWTDVWKAQHDRAFMVAGAAKADLLADLAAAVDGAIADGQSIGWFRQQFDEIVAKHGWAYEGERNWRTRVIYQTNMSTSYAAGRLAQLRDPALQQLKPYWMYKHSDGELYPRPLHLSWNGLTLPADDPWFETHYPPNGWGCECYIVAMSRAEAERQSGRFTNPPDDGINPNTGEPNGIDRGWGYMPGDTVTGDIRQQIEQKLETLPAPLAASLQADLAQAQQSVSLEQALKQVEGEIAAAPVEHTAVLDAAGNILLRKSGDAYQVGFTVEELAQLKDAIVTHNHPGVASFSISDIGLMIQYDVAEMRAVDAAYIYSAARPAEGWTAQDKEALMQVIHDTEAAVVGEFMDKFVRGEISEAQIEAELYHELWQRVSAATKLAYDRTAR